VDTPERPDAHIPEVGYHWHPIEDLPEDWPALADPELKFWRTAWAAKKDELLKRAEMQRFLERLEREWAIETGLVENLYYWGPGVTQSLIEHGFLMDILESSHVQGNPVIIQQQLNDQLQALRLVMDYIGHTRPLTELDIKDLHTMLTEHQDSAPGVHQGKRTEIRLLKGEYKKWPNNPTRSDGAQHQYCPPEHVKSEMERLLDWHRKHQSLGIPPEIEAAWLHHRFVQIHPFQDGNGRVARCLASMVFLQAAIFPLTVRINDRERYYDCLQRSDAGDLRPLVLYFASIQREAILTAMETEGRLKSGPLQEVMLVGIELLQDNEEVAASHQQAIKVAEELWRYIRLECGGILKQLKESLGNGRYKFEAETFEQVDANRRFHGLALELGGVPLRQMEYFRQQLLRLEGPQGFFSLIITIFDPQVPFDGKLVLQALAIQKGEGTQGKELQTCLSDESFEFSFRDSQTAVLDRLYPWLSRALARGMSLWFEQERRIIDALAEQETKPE